MPRVITQKRVLVRSTLFAIAGLSGAILLTVCTLILLRTPSNSRNWTADQYILPEAVFEGDLVTIKHVRNFRYTKNAESITDYYDKTYNLNELASVDFIIEPLASVAVAHTFLSFGFKNGDYVAISVEIRKEVGETFSPLAGLLDAYELMYVIVDERDTLSLRAIQRENPVYLYPAQIKQADIRPLFVSMLNRANTLRETPEFYNTITSTCTTNIVDHINQLAPGTIPFDHRLLLPLDADELAYELELIDTSQSLEVTRATHLISDDIIQSIDQSDFSRRIREHIK